MRFLACLRLSPFFRPMLFPHCQSGFCEALGVAAAEPAFRGATHSHPI
jgi:hypothetical protein